MSKQSECTLHVDGMHCASCEILIEKKLLKQDGIEFVDASQGTGKVHVKYSKDRPNVEALNSEFKDLGYNFSEKKFQKKKENPMIGFNSSGQMVINPSKLSQLWKSFAAVAVILIGFLLLERSGIASAVSVTSESPIYMFALFGFVAGMSSCAALIGGLLLSMAKQWNEVYIAEDDVMVRAQPHVMFHIGRLVSFVVLGGVLGFVGEAISFSIEFTSLITIAVAGMMLLLALQMLEVKWAQNFRFTLPKSIGRIAASEESFQGKYAPFITGALTFILPCGFTLAAQTIALSSGSMIQGALIMGAFALGTLPILASISISSIKFNSKPKLTMGFNRVAGMLVLFFAIYNLNAQMNVLGLPSLSDINLNFSSAQAVNPQEVNLSPDGVQTLSITAKGFEYIPTSGTVLKAGVPTVLRVDNQGIQGCGNYMAARGLFPGMVDLLKGDGIVEFTPVAGVYKLTCTMGMVPPVTITVV